MVDVSRIRISCHIPYVAITELECNESVNEHAEIHVKLQISNKIIIWLETNSLCNRTIEIEMKQEEQAAVILMGNIDRAQWETVNGQFFLTLHARSMTVSMDRVKRICIYQKMGLSYQVFFEKIIKPYKGRLRIDEKDHYSLELPLLQYQETDWEFIKGQAQQLGINIFVNVSSNYPDFSLGNGNERVNILDAIISRRESFLERGCYIQTRKNCMLGSSVQVGEKQLTVLRKDTKLKNGCIEYHCFIGILEEREKFFNPDLKGIAIRGTVLDVIGNFLKLDFGRKKDREEMESNVHYPFYPITGHTMYAMPEVGAEVELYFPSSDMKRAYVRNCFLSSREWPDESIKTMNTSYDKSLTMRPGEILWMAQSNIKKEEIRLQDRRGLQIASSENIVFESKGDIMIRAGMSCMITASHAIMMEQSDTIHSIQLSGNGIQMRSYRHEVSSTEKGGKVRRPQVNTRSEYDSTEIQQYAIAALSRETKDLLTEQSLASIPLMAANNITKKSLSGYTG